MTVGAFNPTDPLTGLNAPIQPDLPVVKTDSLSFLRRGLGKGSRRVRGPTATKTSKNVQ
jgi:hypothetical protein